MLKKLDYDYVLVSKPSVIEVEGSNITISIDKDNNITFLGQNKVILQSDNLVLEGDTINIHAKESFNLDVDGKIYLGASEHIEQQAPRIDLNPKIMSSGYRKKDER
jgi:lipopolysaccharide export system protein LptA